MTPQTPKSPVQHPNVRDVATRLIASTVWKKVLEQRRQAAVQAAADELYALVQPVKHEPMDGDTARRVGILLQEWFRRRGLVLLRPGPNPRNPWAGAITLAFRGYWNVPPVSDWTLTVQSCPSYEFDWREFALTFSSAAVEPQLN